MMILEEGGRRRLENIFGGNADVDTLNQSVKTRYSNNYTTLFIFLLYFINIVLFLKI